MAAVPQGVLDKIAEAIRHSKCVPFLGAGVSAGGNGKPGLLLGGALAKLMVDEMARDGRNGYIRNPSSLPEVSTHYEHYYKRYGLYSFMKTKLPHETIAPLGAHEALAKLPFRIIITTNFDTLMERALDGKRQYKRVIQPRRGWEQDPTPMSLYGDLVNPTKLILYKSHGCFSQDPTDNLVVTDDDYLELLSTMRSDPESPPKAISGPFALSTLLFLGFGLEDVDFKMLYKAVDRFPANMRPPAYAIQLTSSAFAKEYWSNRGIEIYDCDLSDFLTALVDTYKP
jgi:hypothetical protein